VLSKKIGIDLGTSTVTVYVKGEGIVLNEPPMVATDGEGKRVLAVGVAASELAGRGTAPRLVRAVSNGSVVDYRSAGAMLQHVIARVCGRQRIFRPDVMLAVPSTVTGVERRAVLEATMQAGAKTAYLIEKPLAAAIGAGLPIAATEGIAVCDLGAGGAEAAVIAQGEMVATVAIPVGGSRLDDAIAAMVEARRGVRLSAADAERLKIELGRALPADSPATAQAWGRDEAGERRQVSIDAGEVRAAIVPLLEEVAEHLDRMFRQTSAAVIPHVRRSGLVLTGGGAQLRDLDRFLSGRLELPVRMARNPQACVATGTGIALENLQIIRRGQHYIS
jgi:rod shape-determining protein MreB and related proteins